MSDPAARGNPYAPPRADVAPAHDVSARDETGPFSPAGRFGRLSYVAWSWCLMMVAGLALGAVGAVVTSLFAVNAAAVPVLAGLWNLALLVPAAIFMIRRLHDLNQSGWLWLLVLVPLINVIMILVLLFAPGTAGANKHGPPRETPTWEKVVAVVGIALWALGLLAALVLPVLVGLERT